MNKLSGYWVCKYALQTTYMRPCFHKASSQLMLCSIDSDPRPTPPPQKPTLPTTSFRDGSTPDSAVLASNHSHLLPYLSVSSLSQKFSSLIRKKSNSHLVPRRVLFACGTDVLYCWRALSSDGDPMRADRWVDSLLCLEDAVSMLFRNNDRVLNFYRSIYILYSLKTLIASLKCCISELWSQWRSSQCPFWNWNLEFGNISRPDCLTWGLASFRPVTCMPYRSLTEALMAREAGGTQPIQSSRGRQGQAPTSLVTLQVNTGRQHRAKQPAHTHTLGQLTVHKNRITDILNVTFGHLQSPMSL